MTDASRHQIIIAAAIGAIPVLTVCVFVPLALYAGNNGEFAASYYDFLRAILPYAAALVAVVGLPGALLSGALFRRYIAVIAALGLLVWLQGNILVWDYGVLDGRDIDWIADGWRGVIDITVWSIVLGVALVGYKRFARTLVLAAVAVFGIQCIAAVTVLVSQVGSLQAPSEIDLDGAAGEAMSRFSRQQNVVHIVMDGFQSDIFSAIIDSPENAYLKEQLKGFTVFRDNLGAFPYTQMSIPAFLSSKLYRNKTPVDDYVGDVLSGDTILNAAFDAGFEVDIAAPIPLKHVYSRGKHSHAFAISASEDSTEEYYVHGDLAMLMDLSLFRVVPHFAKNLIYRDGLWLLQPMMEIRVDGAVQYFADLLFLERLARTMTAVRDAPVYKMFHLMLSHRPTVGNENCEFDGLRGTNRANVALQARCGLKWVVAVLRRMREIGIYKDSLIVLMGDHGAWVPVNRLMNQEANRTGIEPLWVGMATPVLALKPPGASGKLQVSDAPTSVIDVPATISELLGLGAEFDGLSVFSIADDPLRDRRHLIYNYGVNPDAEGFLYPMMEFRVEGKSLDASAWYLHAKHYPAVQNGD